MVSSEKVDQGSNHISYLLPKHAINFLNINMHKSLYLFVQGPENSHESDLIQMLSATAHLTL